MIFFLIIKNPDPFHLTSLFHNGLKGDALYAPSSFGFNFPDRCMDTPTNPRRDNIRHWLYCIIYSAC